MTPTEPIPISVRNISLSEWEADRQREAEREAERQWWRQMGYRIESAKPDLPDSDLDRIATIRTELESIVSQWEKHKRLRALEEEAEQLKSELGEKPK